MRKVKETVVVLVLATLCGFAIVKFGGLIGNAECAWCPSYKCFGSCGFGCSCVTIGGQNGGMCVSVERAKEAKAHGYTVIDPR